MKLLEHTTVFAMQGCLLLGLSIVLFGFGRGGRPAGGGYRWLAAAYLSMGAGLALLATEHLWHGRLAMLLGNALLLMFYPLTARGLGMVTGHRTRADVYLMLVVAATLVDFSYFTFVQPRPLLLSWESGVITAGICGWFIAALLRCRETAIRPAVRAAAAMLGLHLFASLSRLVVWRYTHTHLWFSGVNVISSVGLTLAYLWIGMLRKNAWLQQTAMTDPLTGLYNRRAMEMLAGRELLRTSRAGAPCSALMIDVDRFKEINDTLGHFTGDLTLRAVAEVLRAATRPGDIAMRMGGDEFFVVLPDADEAAARAVARRVAAEVAALRLSTPDGAPYAVAVSAGCSTLRGQRTTLQDLMAASDAALYREKSAAEAFRSQ